MLDAFAVTPVEGAEGFFGGLLLLLPLPLLANFALARRGALGLGAAIPDEEEELAVALARPRDN